MKNLIPIPKSIMKSLGIKSTKKGLLIDKTKLTEIEKYQKKQIESPKVKTKSVEEMVNTVVKKKDSDIGLY